MIFRSKSGRSLRQRVLFWIEQKTDRLHALLRHERKEREQRYEVRPKPYYDTFESWNDTLCDGGLAKGAATIRLFVDSQRSFRPNVANFDGQGSFPGGTSFIVQRMRAVVTASDDTLAERVRLGTGVELSIGNMECLSFVLADAEHVPMLGKTIFITPYQSYCVLLEFSPDVSALLRELKTKIGPGAGWVSIRVVLDGMLRREVP